MRGDEGSVLVLLLSSLIPPSVRFRRSAPWLPWSAREVGDDKWGRAVSDRGFENEFSFFRND